MNAVSAPARPAPALSRVLVTGPRATSTTAPASCSTSALTPKILADARPPSACSQSLLRPADGARSSAPGAARSGSRARVAALTSVEHDERWHETVTATLKAAGCGNVDYILAPGDQPMERGGDSAYARTALASPTPASTSRSSTGTTGITRPNSSCPRSSRAECSSSTTSTGTCRASRKRRIRGPPRSARRHRSGPRSRRDSPDGGRSGQVPGYGTRPSSSRADFVKS